MPRAGPTFARGALRGTWLASAEANPFSLGKEYYLYGFSLIFSLVIQQPHPPPKPADRLHRSASADSLDDNSPQRNHHLLYPEAVLAQFVRPKGYAGIGVVGISDKLGVFDFRLSAVPITSTCELAELRNYPPSLSQMFVFQLRGTGDGMIVALSLR